MNKDQTVAMLSKSVDKAKADKKPNERGTIGALRVILNMADAVETNTAADCCKRVCCACFSASDNPSGIWQKASRSEMNNGHPGWVHFVRDGSISINCDAWEIHEFYNAKMVKENAI